MPAHEKRAATLGPPLIKLMKKCISAPQSRQVTEEISQVKRQEKKHSFIMLADADLILHPHPLPPHFNVGGWLPSRHLRNFFLSNAPPGTWPSAGSRTTPTLNFGGTGG